MMTKYLVCRTDAIRSVTREHQINSSCFPIVVEVPNIDSITAFNSSEEYYEMIVKKACSQIQRTYLGRHEYIVVPMSNAAVVNFERKIDYDVSVKRFV